MRSCSGAASEALGGGGGAQASGMCEGCLHASSSSINPSPHPPAQLTGHPPMPSPRAALPSTPHAHAAPPPHRAFPDAFTVRCFAFEPSDEQIQEDRKGQRNFIMFPPGGRPPLLRRRRRRRACECISTTTAALLLLLLPPPPPPPLPPLLLLCCCGCCCPCLPPTLLPRLVLHACPRSAPSLHCRRRGAAGQPRRGGDARLCCLPAGRAGAVDAERFARHGRAGDAGGRIFDSIIVIYSS